MKSLCKFTLSGLAVIATLVAAARPCAAYYEPENNTPPWSFSQNYGSMPTYLSPNTNAGWGYFDSIDADDTDYYFAVCGNSTMKSVMISFVGGSTHGSAPYDLDLEVYRPNGGFYMGSYGTTTYETVDVSALNMNAVVMKVYGYSGSTGAYSVSITCN